MCRERADIWYWLWNDPISFFKWRKWKSTYFYQDSFWRYWYRWWGCRGKHKDMRWIDEGCDNPDSHWYCFACQREVDEANG